MIKIQWDKKKYFSNNNNIISKTVLFSLNNIVVSIKS